MLWKMHKVLFKLKKKANNLFLDQKFSEILTGSAYALSAQVIATVAGTITSIIIARFYGAEILGILAVINSYLMLVTIFTVLGTDTSILRLIPEHITKYSVSSAFKVYLKTQYFVIGISGIISLILYLTSGFIADKIFSKPHLKSYFALAAFFIIFKSLMRLNTQAVRGVRRIKEFAFMQLLPSISKLLILVSISIFFYHKNLPIYAMFISFIITALVGAWIVNRSLKQQTSSNNTIYSMSIREILTISIPMLMTATMTFIIGQTGVIMLGIFRPEIEVGYYAVAVRLATLTTFILNAVNSMAGPKFSELYNAGKVDELFHVAKKSAKLIFYTTFPILLSLIFFGKPVIMLLYGEDFKVVYGAMVLLIMGQFINSISGATALFMNMTNNQIIFRNFVFIAALLNLFLNILLTPLYGLYGAAAAGMVSLTTWNVTTLYYIKRKYGKTIGYFPFF